MKKIVRIGAIALIAFAAIGVMSCDVMLTLMASPTVSVIDARTGSGINGVTVTLTPIAVEEDQTPQTITGLSGSSGSVVFTSTVPYGTYSVSGTLAGYVFIPFEATIAGWSESLGKMYGVSTSKGTDTDAISIFLTWDTAKDIDAYLTYPDRFIASTEVATPSYSAYYDVSAESRNKVYWDDQDGDGITDASDTPTEASFAYLDIDKNVANGGYGPETMTLRGSLTGKAATSNSFAVNSSTAMLGGVLPDGTYVYLGDAVYYLNGYESSTTSQDMSDDGIRVVITQGDDIKGIFTLPSNMVMKTGSVFRVSLFYSVVGGSISEYYFVFMPDVRITSGTSGIKAIPENSIFVASGKK